MSGYSIALVAILTIAVICSPRVDATATEAASSWALAVGMLAWGTVCLGLTAALLRTGGML